MLNFGKILVCGSLFALVACAADDGGNDENADESGTQGTTVSGTDPSADSSGGMTMSSTTNDPDGSSGDVPGVCQGTLGATAAGESCAANGECASGVCLIYTDVPLDPDAVCGEELEPTDMGCSTHITGTVFDFSTRAPVEGATLKVAGALNAITNPSGATALASATTDAMGRLDVVTDVPVNQAIAIIALVEGAGGYLTATGLASPIEGSVYATGTGIHDLWLVPQTSVDAWSAALGEDPEVPAASLPLGDAGGVVGFVRDATGAPIAGAVIQPAEGSAAVVRYIAADDTITSDMTTETGIFVVIGAAQTGEDFSALVDGSEVATGTAGSANGAVFTLILSAP